MKLTYLHGAALSLLKGIADSGGLLMGLESNCIDQLLFKQIFNKLKDFRKQKQTTFLHYPVTYSSWGGCFYFTFCISPNL